MSKQIDGTEFACLTINADLEAENEKLKKELAQKKDLDKEIEKLEKELAELKAQKEKEKEKEKWQFTEDEKVILRNLPKEYKWIARDNNDKLWLYSDKPEKSSNYAVWKLADNVRGEQLEIIEFNHLFQCIQWSDPEPCEFRNFIRREDDTNKQ